MFINEFPNSKEKHDVKAQLCSYKYTMTRHMLGGGGEGVGGGGSDSRIIGCISIMSS